MSDAVRELDNFNFREQQCNNDDYGASGKSSIISSRVFTGLDRHKHTYHGRKVANLS